MEWFYNKEFFKSELTTSKNKIGQWIKKYSLGQGYPCDIQPIDEKAYKYTWGEDIKSKLQMFSDESLKVDDIIIYNNKTYKIEKKVKWDDYNIYAILESDVTIL